MTRRLLALPLVPLLSLATACGKGAGDSTTISTCATACGKGTRCDLATSLCVKDAPPVVNLRLPAELVTATTFTLEGAVADDVAVKSAQLAVGDDWSDLTLVEGRFSVQLDVAGHDHAPFHVHVRAFDELDQRADAEGDVLVDDVGPKLDAVVANDGGLAGSRLVVTGHVTDGSGAVAAVDLSAPGVEPVSVPVTAGAFVASLAVPAGLDLATFDVSLQAKDAAGNATVFHLPASVDTVAPQGTIDAPAQGQAVGAHVTARGSVSDTTGIAAVRVVLPSGVVAADVTGTQWTASFSLGQADNAPADFTVELVDLVGNVTSLSRHVVVDTVAPSGVFVAPAANAMLAKADALLRPVLQANDGPGAVASVRFRFDGVLAPATDLGGWSATLLVPEVDFTPMDLVAIVTDAAGNEGTVTLPLVVDRVAPQVRLTSPAAGTVFNASRFATSSDVTVSWTMTDRDPLLLPPVVDGVVLAAGASSFAVATPATDNGVTHAGTVRVKDRAGNEGSASYTFVVDRVVPAVAVSAPAANVLLGGGASTVSVSATAHDGLADVAQLTVALDGAPVNALKGNAGAWTASVPLPTLDFVTRQVTVVATDAAGNSATAAVPVRVDTVPPALVITAPAAGAALNAAAVNADGTVTVRWTVTDGDASAGSVSFAGAAVAAAERTHLVVTDFLDTEKSYSPEIVARDSAGNTARRTATFSVDRKAPSLMKLLAGADLRAVDARQFDLVFSEPVKPAAASLDPVVLTSSVGPVRPGTWSADRKTFTTGLFDPDAEVRVVQFNLVDDYGNSLLTSAPGGRVPLHMSGAAFQGTLAVDVAAYDAAADEDGNLSFVVEHSNGAVELFSLPARAGATPMRVWGPADRPQFLRAQASAALVPNADGGVPTHLLGASVSSSCLTLACRGGAPQDRVLTIDGNFVPGLSLDSPSPVAMTVGPALQASDNGLLYGLVTGKTYVRGTTNVTLPWNVQSLGASAARAFVASAGATGTQVAELWCPPAAPSCTAAPITVTTTPQAHDASVVVAPDSACLYVGLDTGGAMLALAGSTTPTWDPPTAGAAIRLAPFGSAVSSAVLEASLSVGGDMLTLRKAVTLGGCSANFQTVKTWWPWNGTGRDFRPIQLGGRPAIVYIDATNTLRTLVP